MTALLTPDELASRWQRPVRWVREQARAGLIPAVRIGGTWRFDPDAVRQYESRHQTADPMALTDRSAARSRRKKVR